MVEGRLWEMNHVIKFRFLIRTMDDKKYVSLVHKDLDAEGAAMVAHCLRQQSQVQELILSHNRIGPEGARSIAEALGSGLTHLELVADHVGNEGAASIARALRTNRVLTHLSLSNNGIGNVDALADALTVSFVLETLDLHANAIEHTDRLGRALAVNRGLQQLNLANNRIRTPQEELANALTTNTTLKVLDLSFNALGEEWGVALGRNLQHNDTLASLDLTGAKIGARGGRAMAKALRVGANGLTRLKLSGCQLGNPGTHWNEALACNTSLLELNLHCNNIGPEGVLGLSHLKRLDLTYNHLGDQGMVYLSEALVTHHDRLAEVFLNQNGIGNRGAKALASALDRINASCSSCSPLAVIHLSKNRIGSEGARALACSLATAAQGHNRTRKLVTLSLRDNPCHDTIAQLEFYLQWNRRKCYELLLQEAPCWPLLLSALLSSSSPEWWKMGHYLLRLKPDIFRN